MKLDFEQRQEAEKLHEQIQSSGRDEFIYELIGLRADAARLDFLEAEANKPGGILLHDGNERGRNGLGLRPGLATRSLRDAIDSAMGSNAELTGGFAATEK